jgi:phosphate transport system permease protein
MTDIAAPAIAGKKSRSDAAALLAKRYRAERRFRAYGVGAIIVTAIFLALVLLDILLKGIPAFTEHRLDLQITADQAALDPDKTGDPTVLLAGDYDGLIRDALRAQFPAVETRADRRLLNGLLSSGAADDFRQMVSNNPSLIGQTIDVPVLLSDDADQYLKGYQTDMTSEPGKGELTLTLDGTTYRAGSSSDDFAQAFADVREFLQERLDALDAEVERLQAAMDGLSPDVAATLTGQIDGLKTTADALRNKLSNATASIELDANFPSILVAVNGGTIKAAKLDGAGIEGEAITVPSTTGASAPGSWSLVTLTTPEADRRVGDKEVIWLEQLRAKGEVEQAFATRFFTSGDSREPELAGLRGALTGSLITLAVTLILCLPIGVAAAVYLEEFAPKNRVTEAIEININNLAAVPSIVFGLLGLAMFLNFFGLPRSAPLVGGLVLALLVLPTIIIASRAALKAVPPSIKEAALGVGASRQQAIFHHVLPLAMPGIMTGTIIGMAHALGETAPLLMIGMVAFIVDIPGGITEAATVLPVQIYLWSDLPEIAFQAKTAATIIVLLVFLFVMNSAAILVRRRFERRW